MQIVLGLLGGLGIGSLLASLVTHWITRRASIQDRWYQEQREAYLGLLQAIHDAAVAPSDEKAKAYALWQTRCDLLVPPTWRAAPDRSWKQMTVLALKGTRHSESCLRRCAPTSEGRIQAAGTTKCRAPCRSRRPDRDRLMRFSFLAASNSVLSVY